MIVWNQNLKVKMNVPTATFDITTPRNPPENQVASFELFCIECSNALPVQPVPMTCCLRIICKPCIKRKAKELLTMPLKMKQQLMQLQAQKNNGQAPKELLYECPPCGSLHPIKEMLRWPVNQIVDAYIKEVLVAQNGKEVNHIEAEEQKLANELGEDDSPFNKTLCERCEKAKPKQVCYDCGSFGSALCEPCSSLIHQCGSFAKHKVISIESSKDKSKTSKNEYLLEDMKSANNNSFLCRDHANADYEKYCSTCHTLMCAKCIIGHPSKHSVKNLKEAADDVVGSFRSTLDKINDCRSKTEQQINGIKVMMSRVETDSHKVESLIRSKTSQIKFLLESKEKELITQLHTQKQRQLNELVQEKIILEDFKLKEYFPLKLFEILEEKIHSKEVQFNNLLSQTKYFKKLLEQTYQMRKQQSTNKDSDSDSTKQIITGELVETKMYSIGEHVEKIINEVINPSTKIAQTAKPLSPPSEKQKPSEVLIESKGRNTEAPSQSLTIVQKKPIVLQQQPLNQSPSMKSFDDQNKSLSRQTFNKSSVQAKHSETLPNISEVTRKSKPLKRDSDKTPKQGKRPSFIEEKQSLLSQPNQQSLLLKKRQFTKSECSSTSIKLQWEHLKDQQFSFGASQIIYLLEYGIGVKVSGVEQFRQVYQGKAHRCIITDLNPRTSYRIRVAAGILNVESGNEILEIGDWSDVIQVLTQDNQRISGNTVDDYLVSRFTPDSSPINGQDFESSFISAYSCQDVKKQQDTYQFLGPSYIYGQNNWNFGKHYFLVDANILDSLSKSSSGSGFTCHLTVGLVCTVNPKKKDDKTPTRDSKLKPKKASSEEEEEKVIVGCKVSVKEQANIQVLVNLEKRVLICIANGKVQEKFDLSSYSSCVPLIKYDGDAHQCSKVVVNAVFDQQVPQNIDALIQELAQESRNSSHFDSQLSAGQLQSPQNNMLQTKSVIQGGGISLINPQKRNNSGKNASSTVLHHLL